MHCILYGKPDNLVHSEVKWVCFCGCRAILVEEILTLATQARDRRSTMKQSSAIKQKRKGKKIQVDTGIKEKKFYISEKNLNKSLKAKSFIFSSLKCDVSKNKYDGNLSNASK